MYHGKHFGWVRDLPDHRDLQFVPFAVTKPSSFFLNEEWLHPVLDQGELGSCTANAWGAAFYYLLGKESVQDRKLPSRLMLYYDERERLHTTSIDSGASIRDGAMVLIKNGCCHEEHWPYIIERYRVKPNTACYAEAEQHQLLKAYRLDHLRISRMQDCLLMGFPFVFGFTVYESFMSDAVAKTGLVPMPSKDEKVLGGHAVYAVGYDVSRRAFKVANSWGQDWGDDGFFWMPFEYISSRYLAADFWSIQKVEAE